MSKKIEGYKYILDEKSGERDALIAKIGKDTFEALCRIGLIKQGVDGKWISRWKCTPLGESVLGAYVSSWELGRRIGAL